MDILLSIINLFVFLTVTFINLPFFFFFCPDFYKIFIYLSNSKELLRNYSV